MSHNFVRGQSVAETCLAEYRDRHWLIAKFQMRHRLIPELKPSWHNIIYDALPIRVYILRELFAP